MCVCGSEFHLPSAFDCDSLSLVLFCRLKGKKGFTPPTFVGRVRSKVCAKCQWAVRVCVCVCAGWGIVCVCVFWCRALSVIFDQLQ